MSEAPAIVGIFINGESLLPHSPSGAKNPNNDFPISAVLDLVFGVARAHGTEIRERVLVRNWSDTALSGEWGIAVGPLQRRLVQLLHLPPVGIKSPAAQAAADATPGDQLELLVAQRASRWALNTSLTEPDSTVSVVIVGSNAEALFPGAVTVVRMSVAWSAKKPTEVDDANSLTPTLTIGEKLWN